MEGHLAGLLSAGYFECPAVSEVKPQVIGEGIEYVEILSGGRLRFGVDGGERIFTAGAVFWHRAGESTICRTFADDPYRCFVFRFRVRDSSRPGPWVSVWTDPREAVSFSRECHRAFHSGSADPEALAEYAYSTIRWKAVSDLAVRPPDCPAALLAIRDHIRRNLARELPLERIAAAGGISRPYLFALFRKHFHQSPGRYLQEQRIAQAKIMLTASADRSIKEIAFGCGFNGLEVFYRQFKRQTGMTPAEYRRKYLVPVVLTGG